MAEPDPVPTSPIASLRDIYAWDEFITAFETAFHTRWAETAAKLSFIGDGTFFRPGDAAGTASWETRNNLFEAYHKIRRPVELAVIEAKRIEETLAREERWITGDVLVRDVGLMFRTREKVYGCPAGSVCLLGASRGLEHYFLPRYIEAAKAEMTLRLFGVMIPTPGPSKPNTPPATFITWKSHLPTDPDDMPEEQKVIVQPGDRVEGYLVREVSTSESLVQTVIHEFANLQHHPRSCVIILHGFIELLVHTLIEEKCKNGKKIASNKRDYPHSIKLELLHELGVLEDLDFEKLNWLRKLRNDAAHEVIFDINTKNYDLFKGDRFCTPAYFPNVCMQIFMNLWNKNKELFGPRFSPKGQAGEIRGSVFEGRVFEQARPDPGP